MRRTPRLYMIPGAGTDRRMYAPQMDHFSQLTVPEWLEPLHRKEPLTSYAKRLAATLDTSAPFVLGGVSLGGMLAQEMAQHLAPIGVIIISSCADSKALPLYHRMLGKLNRRMPDGYIRTMMKQMSRVVDLPQFKHLPHLELYRAMMLEMPPGFVRWQMGAATEWKLSAPLSVPLFRIHGGKDKLIPLSHVEADAIVHGGSHLINVTHASEVNQLIEAWLAQHT